MAKKDPAKKEVEVKKAAVKVEAPKAQPEKSSQYENDYQSHPKFAKFKQIGAN